MWESILKKSSNQVVFPLGRRRLYMGLLYMLNFGGVIESNNAIYSIPGASSWGSQNGFKDAMKHLGDQLSPLGGWWFSDNNSSELSFNLLGWYDLSPFTTPNDTGLSMTPMSRDLLFFSEKVRSLCEDLEISLDPNDVLKEIDVILG